jgi:hypothetical protein
VVAPKTTAGAPGVLAAWAWNNSGNVNSGNVSSGNPRRAFLGWFRSEGINHGDPHSGGRAMGA